MGGVVVVSEGKNVWVPGERVGDVPLRGEFEAYENLLRGRWVTSAHEVEGGHLRREVVDARHDLRLSFFDGSLVTLMAQRSLILDGVQLFGRSPDELVAALGPGAEAYQEPWVDEELWMVEHPMLGLLAFYHQEPYGSPDAIGLSSGRRGG